MAKKQTWFFDHTTLPKKLIINGEERDITGIFLCYSPRAMFCGECGTMYNCREFTSIDFDGYVCPTCGTVHSNKSVVNERLHIGGYFSDTIISYDGRNIVEVSKRYDIKETGKKLFRIEAGDTKTQILHISKWRSYSNALKRKFLEENRARLPEMFIVLAELELEGKISSYSCGGYYERLDIVKDYYTNNPALLIDLLNANDGVFMKYDEFEACFPDYLLPLTGKVIKDHNPAYYRKYSWNSRPELPPIESFANYEALMCVVSYYKSGLISYNQMVELLNMPKGLNNPYFVQAFKKNYMQMGTYLRDLSEKVSNISTCKFDLKEFYRQKTINYFVEYGYTLDQVIDALDGAKDELDFLNRIGSTRRKLK